MRIDAIRLRRGDHRGQGMAVLNDLRLDLTIGTVAPDIADIELGLAEKLHAVGIHEEAQVRTAPRKWRVGEGNKVFRFQHAKNSFLHNAFTIEAVGAAGCSQWGWPAAIQQELRPGSV